MKVALCACAKNEQLYLRDWIEYHLKIGIDHIYIYDNNPLNNISHVEIINQYPSVTWIDARGPKLGQIGYQSGAYQQCYDRYNTLYTYIGFIDIDEYLTFSGKLDVNSFFSQDIIQPYNIIHMNWKCYGDNDLIGYDSRPVYIRFCKPCHDDVIYANTFHENNHVKSFIKCGLPYAHIGIHTSIVPGLCGRANGNIGNMESSFEPYDFTGGFIRHYVTKSLLEYIDRRCVDTSIATSDNKIDANKRLNWFFNMNKHTPVKDKIVDLFKKSMRI